MDDNNIEEPPKVVPEKLTNEEWLELKQECIAEEAAREKETTKEEIEEPQECAQ